MDKELHLSIKKIRKAYHHYTKHPQFLSLVLRGQYDDAYGERIFTLLVFKSRLDPAPVLDVLTCIAMHSIAKTATLPSSP